MVLEWEDQLLLLDAGMLFPTAEMPGVDFIVPDFEYLAERRDQLRGILLTHGHEDHIGALSYALAAAPAPVYGSRLTLGFARRRLQERGVRAELRTLTPGVPVEIGPFRVHPIRVAHSVVDSLALAIETPAGVVLASGDFKIDAQAPPAERTDVEALSEWGDRGVLALLSDSTNVEQPGLTPGEDAVVPAFEEVLARTRGRVLVACFASSVPRIQKVAELAGAAGRPIAFLGRRMIDNTETALELGLLQLGGVTRLDTASLRGRVRRARAAVRLGQPGRAALGARDDQPGRAPRRGRRPRRHGGALGTRDSRQRARRLAPDQQPLPPGLRRGPPRHRARPRLRPRQP